VVAPYPADQTEFWGSPMKIFEYMAAGKAIVASDVGQLGEVLENRKTAMLYPAGDSAALAKAIMLLREDRSLREILGVNARREAEAKYGWDTYAGNLSGILEL
jgi:glycosyltransferase involved in cell wall biosynthesis